jgi:hypothetical protein
MCIDSKYTEMAIGLYGPHQQFVSLFVVLLQCTFPFLRQNYGEDCVSPLCSGTYWFRQQILDKHNELRRRVAKGLEKRGNPGPQPPAANMQGMVSKILLALHQSANTYSNTGFYCQWRSQNRISHYILILHFMEGRRNIGTGWRRHYINL